METVQRYVLLALLLVWQAPAFAQTGIQFEQGTFDEALDKAAKEDKYLFVDAVTEWCGPCKWMAANTFKDPKVAALFNAKFVNYQLDMEKGEGPEVQIRYGVMAYPTLLFLEGDGTMIHKAIGAKNAVDFVALGESVYGDAFVTIPEMQAKFAAGERDRQFLYEYLVRLNESNMDTQEALALYKEGMKGEALLEKNNWDIFKRMFYRLDTEYFQYLNANKEKFVALYGQEDVDGKILSMYRSAYSGAIYRKDTLGAEKAIVLIANSGIKDAAYQAELHRAFWYDYLNDWSAMVGSVNRLVEEYGLKTSGDLNHFAWQIYENSGDKKHLKAALAWTEVGILDYANSYIWDTKAMLLYKLGRKKEAIVAAEEAIRVGKELGEEVSDTQAILDTWR